MNTAMSAMEVSPVPSARDIATAREAVEAAATETLRAAAELASRERAANESFTAFVDDPSLETKVHRARLAHDRATKKHQIAVAAEKRAREALAALTLEKQADDFEEAARRAEVWHELLLPTFAKLDDLNRAKATLLEEVTDRLFDAAADFDAAKKMEEQLRPFNTLAVRKITRPTLAEALYLSRVYTAHARSARGEDALADALAVSEPPPAWNAEARPAWDRAVKLLKLTKEGE